MYFARELPAGTHSAVQDTIFGVTRLMRQHMRSLTSILNQTGLNMQGQGRCMMLLAKNPGYGQHELAKLMHIEPATLSPMLKRMETAGLVTRKRDDSDNRVIRVALTKRGESLTRQFQDVMRLYTDEVFTALTPEDTRELTRLLSLLQTGMTRAHETCRIRILSKSEVNAQ